jgi:hypothetical protein
MCQHREHRFRITISLSEKDKFDLVLYAKGLPEAVAKADAWAHENYPNRGVRFEIGRMGYSDLASALEHGAAIRLDLESIQAA